MQGFTSFILVFISACLLLWLARLDAAAGPAGLSDAVALERAYGIIMNAKECAIEAVGQGAASGFGAYGATHDRESCVHCPDHFCSPPTPTDPYPPNVCDGELCSACFRESEARQAASGAGAAALAALGSHDFDDDFSVTYAQSGGTGAALEAALAHDPSEPDGCRLGMVRFVEPLIIRVESRRLGVSLAGRVPEGTVVGHGADDD